MLCRLSLPCGIDSCSPLSGDDEVVVATNEVEPSEFEDHGLVELGLEAHRDLSR